MRPPLAAIAPLVGALAWVAALIVEPGPLHPVPSVLLLGIGLIVLAAVSTSGLVVLGARWAYRLGWVVLGTGAMVALIRPIDAAWGVALAITALGAIALGTVVQGRLRRLPSADGPPVPALMLPLTLVGAPVVLGLTGAGPSWATIAIGLGALGAAFLYARVVFGGLVTARVVWPLTTLAITPFLDTPAIPAAVVLAGVVLILAWHPSSKAAYHPPRTVGSTFPIPPELTPGEILDAAGLDEHGRRRS